MTWLLNVLERPQEPVFKHVALDNAQRTIRLIKLDKSIGPRVRCTIEHFDMANGLPQYTALSYTWGPASPARLITVNGAAFVVHMNLFRFLRAFKRNDRNQYYLWVDQLCIDQSAVDERNHQVKMMAEIYSSAHEVIVWLGAATGRMKCVAQFLTNFSKLPGSSIKLRENRKRINLSHPTAKGEWEKEAWHRYRSTRGRLLRLQTLRFSDVLHFTRVAYWSRLWVVQEICLARRCTIFCNGKWIPWGTWSEFIRAVGKQSILHWGENIIAPQINFLASDMASEGRFALMTNGSTLSEALANLHHCHCCEPRDRVYSILGIVRNGVCIEIDYEKPVEDVFRDALRLMCQEYRLESSAREKITSTLGSRRRAARWEGESDFLKVAVALGVEMTAYRHPKSTWPDVFEVLRAYLEETWQDENKRHCIDQSAYDRYVDLWKPFKELEERSDRADWLEQKVLEILSEVLPDDI